MHVEITPTRRAPALSLPIKTGEATRRSSNLHPRKSVQDVLLMTVHPAHAGHAKDYTLLSHYDDNAMPPLRLAQAHEQ